MGIVVPLVLSSFQVGWEGVNQKTYGSFVICKELQRCKTDIVLLLSAAEQFTQELVSL